MTTTDITTAYRFHRLKHSASEALARARADVAAGTARHFHGTHDGGWGPEFPAAGSGPRTRYTARWVEKLGDAGLRFVGFADEICRSIPHKGWYSHPEGEEPYRGAVLQLPGRGGSAQYLAAYADPVNPGAYLVDTSEILCATDRDAAYAADSFAERQAEQEREYQEAWQAGSQYTNMLENAAEMEAEADQIQAAKNTAGAFPPIIATHITNKIDELRLKAKRLRNEAEDLRASVRRGRLTEAFNEGAGIVSITPVPATVEAP